MGVTIHYRGKLNTPNLIPVICEELEDISKEMNWKYYIMDEDLYQPNTSYFDGPGTIKGHIPLKGISITVHPDVESLSFFFDKTGHLRSLVTMVWMNEKQLKESSVSVKTQFAPIAIHIAIIKLLKYIKEKYITDLEVNDEGQYWETGDEAILKENMDFLNKKLDEVGDYLSHTEIEKNETPSSVVEKIEQVLRNIYGR